MPTEPRFRRDRHPMCTCPTVPGPFGKRIDMQPDCPGGWVPLSTREQATEAALSVIRPELAHQAEAETCTCDRVDVSFGAIGDQPLTRQSMPGLRDPDCPFHGRGQQ